MQIFFFNLDPSLSAAELADIHTRSAINETTQLLCGAIHSLFLSSGYWHKLPDHPKLPGISHLQHPCALWTRKSEGNFVWLLDYGLAVCKEYAIRYADPKKPDKQHVYQKLFEQIQTIHLPLMREHKMFPASEFTLPVACMPRGLTKLSHPEYAFLFDDVRCEEIVGGSWSKYPLHLGCGREELNCVIWCYRLLYCTIKQNLVAWKKVPAKLPPWFDYAKVIAEHVDFRKWIIRNKEDKQRVDKEIKKEKSEDKLVSRKQKNKQPTLTTQTKSLPLKKRKLIK